MSIGLALILALGAAPLVEGPAQTSASTWSGKAVPRGDALLRDEALAVHAAARQQHGAPPLTWNDRLAADALAYAQVLARTHSFDHDPQDGVDEPEGENLSMGTRKAYRYRELVQFWADERKDFKPGSFPDISKSGDWSRVGHYTQMVWPETRQVGCAVASNEENDYLVCRYLPAGNVIGDTLR